MHSDLSLVHATGSGCLIHRQTSGRYLVSLEEHPDQRRWAATLAEAHAACSGWERQGRAAVGPHSGGP